MNLDLANISYVDNWLLIGIVALRFAIPIAVVLLLLFSNRLPEIARNLGMAIREFKQGLAEVDQFDVNNKRNNP